MTIELLKANIDKLEPITVLNRHNELHLEVGLHCWKKRYSVATFSWNDHIDKEGREYVYHIKDENWHDTPMEAIKAYLDTM